MSCGGCLPIWLDCSPEAQDARKRQLQGLMAKASSGVSSIGDRGRSVSYRSAEDLKPVIQQLQKELIACETGRWPSGRRLSYIDQVKGL